MVAASVGEAKMNDNFLRVVCRERKIRVPGLLLNCIRTICSIRMIILWTWIHHTFILTLSEINLEAKE